MIKGVNKQVLEINETKSGYFEKAIFFVKPEYFGFSEGRLREYAENELDSVGMPPQRRKEIKKSRWKKRIVFGAIFAAGILAGIAFAMILQ